MFCTGNLLACLQHRGLHGENLRKQNKLREFFGNIFCMRGKSRGFEKVFNSTESDSQENTLRNKHLNWNKMGSLTISCSPKTYSRVKNDNKYRLQLTENVLSQQGRSFSHVLFKQIETPESDLLHETPAAENDHRRLNGKPNSVLHETPPAENDHRRLNGEPNSVLHETPPAENDHRRLNGAPNSVLHETPPAENALTCLNDDGKVYWNDATTKLMLSLIEEMRPKVGKSIHYKTKSKMYQSITERMSVEGYNYTPAQVENKFRGLERTYKKMVQHNRLTGRNRQTCAWESELHRILGDKKGIYPEFVLDSDDAEGSPFSPNSTPDHSDADQSQADNIQSPVLKRSKVGVRHQVLVKIDEMIAEKKASNEIIHEYLRKKEERSEKKVKLFETLVEQLKK